MIKHTLRTLFALVILLAFANFAQGGTKIWLGGTAGPDNWNIAGNWSTSGIPTATDDVQIGIAGFTNQPSISSGNPSCLSITLGTAKAVTLTVTGVTLAVTGGITQDDKAANGGIIGTITGTGTITCGSFAVGNGTTPTTAPGNGTGPSITNTTVINCSINNLTVNGTLTLKSIGTPNNNSKFWNNNNPVFNLLALGNLTVNAITTTNTTAETGAGAVNATIFNMVLTSGTNINSLTLNGTTPFATIATTGTSINFTSASGLPNLSTVIYNSSSAQTVYTTADANATFINISPTMYPNLIIQNTGAKTIHGTAITVGGSWTTNGAAINLATNNPIATISGSWSNSATVTQGTGAISAASLTNSTGGAITGSATTLTFTGNITNSATITAGTGKISAVNFNNSGGTFNGNAASAITTFSGTLTNTGTITVNAENMTFTGAATNSGTYTGGAGSSIFLNGLDNSGGFTGGAGAVTIIAGTGTLTNNSGGTVSDNGGTMTIGTLTNNIGGNVTGNATSGAITVNGILTNAGTVTVNNGAFTFTGAASNTGSYLPGTGSGNSIFSNGLANSGTFTGGAGAITITAGTGTLTNTGTVTGGTGTITTATLANNSGTINGSSTTGGITVTGTSSNAATVNANKGTMLFGGVLTNTGTYTGGTGTSTFTAGLTNSLTVTESTGQFTIGNLINNSPGTFTGNSAAATTSVTGALTNSGTITVNAENITVAGASSNSGAYTGGAGTSTFTTGLTNTGTVNEGAGTFTLGDLTNTSPGIFNGNPTTAATSTIGTMTNTGTITVGFETMTFSGAAVNSGTYTAGAPGISTFNGSFTNSGSGTFAAGTADVNFNGNYTNSATFTGNATGKIIFGGAGAQTLTDNSTNGTIMLNPFVQGSGIKSMSGSKGFFVPSTGILTMAGTATLDGGGALTLNSDANSAATLAYVPPGCSITGNVNVQRFIQGNNDINKRGYRLLSSSVYNGVDAASGNAHVYSLQYLTNSVYVSGAGALAGGFNVTTTQNPSVYLYREDVAPPPSSTTVFTTGYNWKGVAKINNTPAYNIGTQAKNTTTNINDATVTIPVGNGLLFFFRGDNHTPANLAFPAGAPQDVTLTQTGTPNTGTVDVRLWYAADANLGNNLSYTASTDVGSLVLRGGYALVGNPYPSTINWEKYNANATVANSSIYGGGGLNSKIYVFNPTNKQYEAYIPTGIDTVSINPAFSTAQGQASNMIASGQGFFIKADAAGETLSFREGAKTSTQPLAASLNKLMGTPKAFATAPNPLLRLRMSKDSINTDEIVIRLNSQSSTKFGDKKDAEDLDGSSPLVSLSAFSSDSIRVSIYSTAYPGLQQQVIPLFVSATATGLYKLDRKQLDNLPALYEVWLKDAFMNDSLDMKANATYQFNIDKTNPATFGKNRFTLVIRQNSALAYQLLDFTGSKVGNSLHAQLVWNTLNEQNYVNFTVERSNDGGKTFGVVGGLQSTGAGNYSMVDKNAVKGLNLYRLKQEDINNTITYSNIVQLIFDDKGNKDNDGKLSIYPNPAVNNINLAVAAESNGNNSYSIRFTSSSGIVVKQITASQPSWQGNISNLQPGTYLVRVINNKTQNLVGENKFVKL
jgi:hypothetical protein